MSEEEIQMDCEKTEKKEFSRGFRIFAVLCYSKYGICRT